MHQMGAGWCISGPTSLQRLVGLSQACDYRISTVGLQGWGCPPPSPLLIYSSCMIRDHSRKVGDAVGGGGVEDRAEGGERGKERGE